MCADVEFTMFYFIYLEICIFIIYKTIIMYDIYIFIYYKLCITWKFLFLFTDHKMKLG